MSGVGTLLGIARHPFSKAPMETVERVAVTCEGGIAGDFRGAMRRGPYKRQVTLIEAADWQAALAEVGHVLPWSDRRANLLVDVDLPQAAGARVRIGDVVLEITRECDPCERMEALAPGLKAALLPDWRGGACARVITGGEIAVGDRVEIEATWTGNSERSTISATFAASASSSARI
ncbi:MOSC domain-containing protein [Sphingomonas sp.]|uniref:MOSC domain-containing protein n=1 Tax=Sphingomonas sp. TaxID=28214 RepID=UPI0035C7D73B